MNAYEEGYYAGLVNDRDCPHDQWSYESLLWHVGNQTGLTVHCAVVEAVYLNSEHDG